ncbi:hypothetical protein C1634_020595 [Chryseobacterium viscerum]|uniref:Uncharacterized protein n=2 Tax=Chryseobacterium viscerum TaxID=1037377 RepID=A0A316WC61_9FLAO|nr:hypothetical protein C1634_020595 [Chryseobacterium viscerum]
MYSCSVSTKDISSSEENGFFFKMKHKFTEINYENYQILIPKKLNTEEKAIVKIKDKTKRNSEKELNQDEHLRIQLILKSDNNLYEENEKSIIKILNLDS